MKRTWDDARLENIIGNLLRAGVLLAATVVLIGGLLYLTRNHSEPISYREFRGEPQELRSIPLIAHDAAALAPLAVIQLGLLLLIATPVLRVGFAIVGFGLERDWLYTGVSALVLGILMYSLMHAA